MEWLIRWLHPTLLERAQRAVRAHYGAKWRHVRSIVRRTTTEPTGGPQRPVQQPTENTTPSEARNLWDAQHRTGQRYS